MLAFFLVNQDKVLSRDELMADVWDNRIVSDDAINRCISILRQTLTPEDKNAYIETVVRKGYIAHFPPAQAQEQEHPGADKSPGRTPVVLIAAGAFAALAALSIVAVLLITLFTRGDERPVSTASGVQVNEVPVVAALPFVPASGSEDSVFFANGMHNDLLTQLAKLQSLRVISSTSVQEYRGIERNLRVIGQELGANVILEGSVQIALDQIRINAQLIDAESDEHLWAESYDRELSPANIFEVQSEIAHAIAKALHATLTEQDDRQLAQIPTENMAAYRAYHRAMQMRDRDAGASSSAVYVEALEEAVGLDPSFGRAWAELVSALAFQNFSGQDPDKTARAERALAQLEKAAPNSADLLIGQGAYAYYALRDYDRAHELISQAVRLNPSDVNAIQLRSWIERRQGNFEALVESRREARRLDPRNPILTDIFLAGLLVTHQYDAVLADVEASSVESLMLARTRNLLEFREHRDFGRLQEQVQGLCRSYDQPDCGWIEHIGNRDFAKALESLNGSSEAVDHRSLSTADRHRIFTLWLMDDGQISETDMQRWRDQLETDSDQLSEHPQMTFYLSSALLAGVQGNFEEAEDWVKRWLKHRPIDWAERSSGRDEFCRVLGMIEATHATVECIRDGLKEPSLVMPFFEPYLPFYDALRNKPEFMEMVVEIDGAGSN